MNMVISKYSYYRLIPNLANLSPINNFARTIIPLTIAIGISGCPILNLKTNLKSKFYPMLCKEKQMQKQASVGKIVMVKQTIQVHHHT